MSNISLFWADRLFLAQHLSMFFKNVLNRFVRKIIIQNYELVCYLRKNVFLYGFSNFLKLHTNCQFKVLIDIAVVDFPQKKERFEIHYFFLSVLYNARISFVVSTNEFLPIPSLSFIYNSAVWVEREVWDLFGIFFVGNKDLRRILTDYGFKGHPLKKDFPLTGYIELFYDEIQKRIIYGPVSLAQEFRIFKFQNPWKKLI
jgi:NADH:ubiquinone oxidoreductase subunit C